jgi:hypothetical protein
MIGDKKTILWLTRKWFTNISTIGELFIDGEFICFTLEDTVRKYGEKIYGKTAIPKGLYEIAISYSNKFKKLLPLLLNVPFFTGIRIHSGNKAEDTEGCILVGKNKPKEPDLILDSRLAFASLMVRIQDLMKTGKVFINIENGNGMR